MKSCFSTMSVLLSLALPVAATCADVPKAPEKAKAVEASADVSKAPEKAGAVKASPDEASKTGHSMMTGGNAAPAAAPVQNPAGKVVETMNSGGYTYANLERNGKTTWVAFSLLETHVGDTLTFLGCMEMSKFQSKSLNRTFDAIFFCGAPEGASNAAAAKQAPRVSPGSGGAAATSTAKIKVAKARGANAYTVADVFAKRAKLHGKTVVVKGKVVKVSSGIMDRNWIHVQDGSGKEKQKTHDLVATSSELPAVGDVVTVTGTLAKDKDFGGGYKYSAIIEKASFKK